MEASFGRDSTAAGPADAEELRASEQRLRLAIDATGIGIWDVLERCERDGSLDSAIVPSSEVANDIPGLLRREPTIAAIALNGAKAYQVFRRRIAPLLDPAASERVQVLALPSTSPANASIPRAAKLERWREMLHWSSRPARPARR